MDTQSHLRHLYIHMTYLIAGVLPTLQLREGIILGNILSNTRDLEQVLLLCLQYFEDIFFPIIKSEFYFLQVQVKVLFGYSSNRIDSSLNQRGFINIDNLELTFYTFNYLICVDFLYKILLIPKKVTCYSMFSLRGILASQFS